VTEYTKDFWEKHFQAEDPWNYTNQYETEKAMRTLSLLPEGKITIAAEVACAEGHFTRQLAPYVDKLLASDISDAAVERARLRCVDLINVSFQTLDLVRDDLPQELDLLVCGEVLYYLPSVLLSTVAAKFVSSLADEGYLLLTHGLIVTDEPDKTGFDWGHEFGGARIARQFEAMAELQLLKEIRTSLYVIQLFQKLTPGTVRLTPAREVLPIEAELPTAVERTVAWDGLRTCARWARDEEISTQIPILVYHGIADDGPEALSRYRVSPEAFRKQMLFLRQNGFHTISLRECADHLLERKSFAGRPIVITFDDGYQNFADNAWPILARHGFSATMFVVTNKVGTYADWDEQPCEALRLMDWATIQRLHKEGAEFGSHTANHANLLESSDEVIASEWQTSADALRSQLGIESPTLAFPYGLTDIRVRSALQEAGCNTAVTTYGGRCTPLHSTIDIPRVEIFSDDDLEAFAAKVLPTRSRLARFQPDHAHVNTSFLEQQEIFMALHPHYASILSSRLDKLVGDFVSLQTQLLAATNATPALENKLAKLFCQPITGRQARLLKPYEYVAPFIRIGFEQDAQVEWVVEPKSRPNSSPTDMINSTEFRFSGVSRWLSLEVAMEWADLAGMTRYQLGFYGQSSRNVSVRTVVRAPNKMGEMVDHRIAAFDMRPDQRNFNTSGTFELPDFITIDTNLDKSPSLIFFFDNKDDLHMKIDYLSFYFS